MTEPDSLRQGFIMERVWHIWCMRCASTDVAATDYEEASRHFRALGWDTVGGRQMCPACVGEQR